MSESEHSHPSDAQYVKVAIVLAIVTAIEVAIFYVPPLKPLLFALLMPLMILKFIMVALYFMHLKYDSKIFRNLFMTGIVFALGVFSILLVTLVVSRG